LNWKIGATNGLKNSLTINPVKEKDVMEKIKRTVYPLEEILVRHFSDHFERLSRYDIPKVTRMRREAIDFFKQNGFPHNKMEKWRNTDMEEIYEEELTVFDREIPFEKVLSEIFLCEVHGFETRVLSVLNGSFYSPEELKLTVDEDGVIVGSLAKAQQEYPELIEKYYGEVMQQEDGLKALNTALASDGVFIYVPDNVEVKNTIQLINILNQPNLVINVRNLIVLGKNAKLTFLHCDDSVNHHAGFINKVNEIYLGENAELELYQLQNMNDETTLLNQTAIHQSANSRLRVNVLSLNGGLIRNEITDLMNGERAWSDIRGLYLMDQQQHIDNQVFVYHNMPHCDSNQLFKGILDNEATGVFNGYIYVARDAQQTNAFQRNSNILLTKTSHVDTMPHLEIYADDVKCSHGASVGQLDNEALFYLMQRGIPFDDARMLLLYAFADAIIKNMNLAIFAGL